MSLISSQHFSGLVRLCIERPISTLAGYAALLILGVFALTQMRLEYGPDIPESQLIVACNAQGFPPDETRKMVSFVLEDALSSLKGLRRMESFSKAGQAIVKLDLWWGTDIRRAQVDASQLVDLAFSRLPQGAEKPLVLPFSQTENPGFWIGLFPKDEDLVEARIAAEREFRTRLQQTEGVGSVTIVGGQQQEVQVNVDQERLFSKGLNLESVASAISDNNIEVPLGTLETQGLSLALKADSKARTIDELSLLVIAGSKAETITLQDIASVKRAPQRQESFFLDADREGILFLVGRQPGKSPLAVAERLRAKVDELQRERGHNFDFILLRDESVTVRSTLTDLAVALGLGSLIALATLFIFVRDFRSALILTSALPISALFAFLALWLCGRSLNVMSLGGLALGLGMLVDNSVVVLENFDKRRGNNCVNTTVLVEATMEMAGSTVGSTLTVAIVFLPLVFLPGAMGAVFTDLSLSMVFSMAASFLVSVTWVPVLYRWTKRSVSNPTNRRLEKTFEHVFRQGLRRPLNILLPVIGLSLIAVLSYLGLNKELFNPIDQGFVQVVVPFNPGTSLASLKAQSASIQKEFATESNIVRVIGFGGREPNSPFFLANPWRPTWELDSLLILKPQASAFELQTKLKRRFPGIEVKLPPSPIESLLRLDSEDHRWILTSDSLPQLEHEITRLRSSDQTQFTPDQRQPIDIIQPRADLGAQLGLTPQAIAQALNGDLEGLTVSAFFENGFPIPIRVTLPPSSKSSIDSLQKIQIPIPNRRSNDPATSVSLATIATITPSAEFPLFWRIDKKDAYPFQIRTDTTPTELAQFQAHFPDAQNVQKNFLSNNLATLALLSGLALLFLYLYLVVQFESYFIPLLVLLTFPLSGAGIFGSLYLAGFSWNINTFFAILILMGSAVNVAIILIENYRRRSKVSLQYTAIVFGGTRERLRPILITTITTIVGSLPVAFDPGSHSTQSGMATAIIGGHLVSTLLTLLVLPGLYLAWIRYRSRVVKSRAHDAP